MKKRVFFFLLTLLLLFPGSQSTESGKSLIPHPHSSRSRNSILSYFTTVFGSSVASSSILHVHHVDVDHVDLALFAYLCIYLRYVCAYGCPDRVCMRENHLLSSPSPSAPLFYPLPLPSRMHFILRTYMCLSLDSVTAVDVRSNSLATG